MTRKHFPRWQQRSEIVLLSLCLIVCGPSIEKSLFNDGIDDYNLIY